MTTSQISKKISALKDKLFCIENSEQSIDISIFPYTIKRRADLRKKYGKYKQVELFYFRYSKLKGYKYINLSIAHYFRINIDLHPPV